MASICIVVESIRVSGRLDSASSAVTGSLFLTVFQDFHFTVSNNLPAKRRENLPIFYAKSVCFSLGKMM